MNANATTSIATQPISHRWKKFNYFVISAVIFMFVCVALINTLVDPYRIFNIINLPNGYTPNERFNKVTFLINNPTKYDAFLLGSSKIGLFDPTDADVLHPTHHYYNLGLFGGHAGDALKILKFLKSRNVAIKEVVYGIDIFPFISAEEEVTPAYRHHPKITGVSLFDFYSGYLFVPSLYHSLIKLQHIYLGAPDIQFDFYTTGRFRLLNWEKQIKKDHDSYISNTFKELPKIKSSVVWVNEQFALLEELKTWLELNNIRNYFFIHPHHRFDVTRLMSQDDLTFFSNRINAITGDIPNFLNNEKWCNDDSLYYEPKHYRPVLAKQVLQKVLL